MIIDIGGGGGALPGSRWKIFTAKHFSSRYADRNSTIPRAGEAPVGSRGHSTATMASPAALPGPWDPQRSTLPSSSWLDNSWGEGGGADQEVDQPPPLRLTLYRPSAHRLRGGFRGSAGRGRGSGIGPLSPHQGRAAGNPGDTRAGHGGVCMIEQKNEVCGREWSWTNLTFDPQKLYWRKFKNLRTRESVKLNFEISCGKIVKIVYNGPIFFPPTGKSPKPAAAPQSYQPSRVKM